MLTMSTIANKFSNNSLKYQGANEEKIPVPPSRSKRSSSSPSGKVVSSGGKLSPNSSVSYQMETKEKESSLVSQMRSLFETSSTTTHNIFNKNNSSADMTKSPVVMLKKEEKSLEVESIESITCSEQNTDQEVKKQPETSEIIAPTEEKGMTYKLKTLPSNLGLPPPKPAKTEALKNLVFPKPMLTNRNRLHSPLMRPKRPPPKPPIDSRGKPLPPLPPLDDQFYDDNMNPEEAENAHSSPAALGIPPDFNLDEELYQDADIYNHEAESIYESMEVDLGEPQKIYVNRQVDEKKKKENERKLKREQKEQERRSKERLRILERFNLTGDEQPMEMGVLKKPVRAWNIDHLSGKEGEKVAILRIEDNPAGKWLAINDKGKIGYVDLNNIEIKPETIRSVMTTTYQCNIKYNSFSEDEDIYECISWDRVAHVIFDGNDMERRK